MKLTKEDIAKIKESNLKFEEALIGYKENPEEYKTGIFYKTPDNSTIEVIYQDDFNVLGVIVKSPIELYIGRLNIFSYEELKKI